MSRRHSFQQGRKSLGSSATDLFRFSEMNISDDMSSSKKGGFFFLKSWKGNNKGNKNNKSQKRIKSVSSFARRKSSPAAGQVMAQDNAASSSEAESSFHRNDFMKPTTVATEHEDATEQDYEESQSSYLEDETAAYGQDNCSAAQQESSAQDESASPTLSSIEVTPGCWLPFRGSAETLRAFRKEDVVHTECASCNLFLYCVDSANMVLCPRCRNISPVTDSRKEGVGLGLTVEEAMAYLSHQ